MAKQQAQQDTLQPHNVDAEEGLLGSLLIDSDAIMRVATLIDEKDFFVIKNGWVYAAMKSLYDKRAPIDNITLTDELEKQGRLMEVGGPAFLTSLTGLVFNSMHLEYYANMVKEAAILREVIDKAGKAARMAYEEGNSASEVVDRVRELFGNVGKRNDGGGLQHFGGALYRQCDNVNDMITRGVVLGIRSGLIDLDRLLSNAVGKTDIPPEKLSGFQKSDLIIFAARPGVGKSGLAVTIAMNAARQGKRVGIFTLEMSTDQLVQRMMSMESELDSSKIRLGYATVEEAKYLEKVAYEMQKLPIYIDDKGGISLEYLRNEALRLHAEIGLDLLIVDYLQLMAGRGENRQVEVSNISKGLKALAKELDIPIIALSQLSRQLESRADKRPILSDLRESGSIEQDADVVLFIYRDEMYNEDTEFPNIAELIIAKHRNGATGKVNAFFKKQFTQFCDADVKSQPLDY